MVAGPGDIDDGEEVGGLSRRCQHRRNAPFEGGNFGSHRIVGRILKTSVEIAALLQVEQTGHLFARFIFKSGALYDGKHSRFSVARSPAALHTFRPDAPTACLCFIF